MLVLAWVEEIFGITTQASLRVQPKGVTSNIIVLVAVRPVDLRSQRIRTITSSGSADTCYRGLFCSSADAS